MRLFKGDEWLSYSVPHNCACIDESGGLRPTGGPSRVEVHCAICERRPFRSPSCLFADYSQERAQERERCHDTEKGVAVCAYLGCGVQIHHDSVVCRRHQGMANRHMQLCGITYDAALAQVIEEAKYTWEEEIDGTIS